MTHWLQSPFQCLAAAEPKEFLRTSGRWGAKQQVTARP